ncbi:hypothetical protein [Aquipuribacter hungaricus]|uniref:Uncharacterized protein n=1 Tax=Aquipuribacter hungaricus TaxID=545624 RepID=A0ABV7WMP1_9MICO
MQISSATPPSYINRAGSTAAAPSARATPSGPTHTEALVGSLTASDRSFLLNAFGMTVTAQGDTMTFHETAGLSGEDGKAASQLASQLMADRQRGAIEGDVTPDYFHALLIRAGDDSGQAFQDMISKALDYLTKGSAVTRVDARA